MEIANPNLLKPGMQAVTKLTQSNRKGLFIPIDAVIREENHKYIFEKSHGLFENVMVETGVEANGMKSRRKWIVQKVVVTGRMPLTVNTYP
jgi:Cu(I)/Ag(I) efflux system membrane fusion protein